MKNISFIILMFCVLHQKQILFLHAIAVYMKSHVDLRLYYIRANDVLNHE